VATVLVVAIVGYLTVAWKDIRVSYHRRQMQLFNDWGDNGVPSLGSFVFGVGYRGAAYEKAAEHRDQLAALGAITRIDYEFSRLEPRIPAVERFTVDVSLNQCPPYVDFEYSDYRPPPEPVRAIVWCEHEHADAWRRFLHERDAPAPPSQATK
jgi:hypothetical protein